MKQFFHISLLFFLSITLCACPYSSPYGIDETPTVYVEDILIGRWMTFIKNNHTTREEAIYITLSKKTDTEYQIAITGNMDELRPYMKVSSDSLSGTAFMSIIGDAQFLNVKINSRIYIAELKLKNEVLSLHPLAEHFTSKMIFSSEALRKSIEVHYKTRVHPVMDESFCLHNLVKLN